MLTHTNTNTDESLVLDQMVFYVNMERMLVLMDLLI